MESSSAMSSPTKTSKGALRRVWMWLHRWLGLILFVALVVLGLSGSALVWDAEFEALLHPARFEVTKAPATLPPSTYVQAAVDALPAGDTISAVQLPPPSGGPVLVGGSPDLDAGRLIGPPPRHRVWLDPTTARVAATSDGAKDLLWFAHAIHGHFAIPGHLPRVIIGWMGWAMLVSCISGLWIWWPRNNNVVKGLRWRRSPSFLNNLHHQVGIWIVIPLAIVSLSGAYIVFPKSFTTAIGVLIFDTTAPTGPADNGHPEGPPPQTPLAATHMTVDEAVETALAAHGGGFASLIVWPRDGAPEWGVSVVCDPNAQGGVLDPCHASYTVRDSDAAVTRHLAPSQTKAQGVGNVLMSLHNGDGMGPVWNIILFLTGIVPALFGVTGVVMWLTGRKHRRVRAKLGDSASRA